MTRRAVHNCCFVLIKFGCVPLQVTYCILVAIEQQHAVLASTSRHGVPAAAHTCAAGLRSAQPDIYRLLKLESTVHPSTGTNISLTPLRLGVSRVISHGGLAPPACHCAHRPGCSCISLELTAPVTGAMRQHQRRQLSSLKARHHLMRSSARLSTPTQPGC